MAAVQLEVEMEVQNAEETFPLNYDCAYELFQWIGFNECMNLTEACADLKPIAEWIYKRKFNKLTFDFGQPIDRILHHAGPTAKSLTLTLNKFGYTESDLISIGDTCKQLRCLTLNGFDSQTVANNPFVNFANEELEVLTLNQCSFANDIGFFDAYKNLKCVNLFKCRNITAIKRCFENNSGVYSFTCNYDYFVFPKSVVKLLPNLERLSLRYNAQVMKLEMLSKLPSLRRLSLLCGGDNVNDVLAALLKSNCLEELVLEDVEIDENTFPLIKSLHHLKLLSVTSSSCPFPASTELPAKLKTLKLGGFRIRNGDIASTVKQLVHLEAINLEDCELWRNSFWISDFDWMVDLINEDLIGEQTHRQLHVVVNSEYDQSPKISQKSNGRIRITNYVENRNLFEISYPGMDDYFPENYEHEQ
jgi:hypothetical protein